MATCPICNGDYSQFCCLDCGWNREQMLLAAMHDIVATCDSVLTFLANSPDAEITRVNMQAFVDSIKVLANTGCAKPKGG